MDVEERIHALLDPVVATRSAELVDVTFTGGTLRVTVDSDGGITTQVLAELNRLISPILDQHDPIPGRYTLEVSSPGLERPLRTAAHYRRAVGEQVVVKLAPTAETRRLRGRLVAVADDDATVEMEVVEIDGVDLDEPQGHNVTLADVASARTVFDWGPSPKPGGPRKGKKKKARRDSNPSTSSTNDEVTLNREVRDEQ